MHLHVIYRHFQERQRQRGNVANRALKPVHAHNWKVILSDSYSTMEKTFGCDVTSRRGNSAAIGSRFKQRPIPSRQCG
ncbi:hypothetical protein T07_11891 [Trichinella nelsoni]|uniref:Uncharacterized protein n=1 Tax=Trichinella nelsoni TaxID=6336 RepID=A0A0V0RZN0_9BILA|nr:hypothetical protein T07_11891 [Trichinella nelsoni]